MRPRQNTDQATPDPSRSLLRDTPRLVLLPIGSISDISRDEDADDDDIA